MKKLTLMVTTILLLSFSIAFSQPLAQPDVKVEMMAKKVISTEKVVDGKQVIEESFETAEGAFPGDIIQYDMVYRNEGDGEAKALQLLGRIPEDTFYLGDTVTILADAEIKYSIDKGGSFHLPPLKYTVVEKDENGIEKEVEKIATPDMYTHIQWNLNRPLMPEEELTVSYRVKIQ